MQKISDYELPEKIKINEGISIYNYGFICSYCIFCRCVPDACMGLVLVEKDGCVTLGPYKNLPGLLKDAGKDCAEMKKENDCTRSWNLVDSKG